ncbi:MAG: aconitate hydratase AcnA [Gammaproteobacteria bacterium]
MMNTLGTRSSLKVGEQSYQIFSLAPLSDRFDLATLPFCLKILLENLLRHEDGVNVTDRDIELLASWDPHAKPQAEIAFTPSRVVLQDFTGVPALVDLAAMRDAIRILGGDPAKINPLSPAELVIDHSVQVDAYASSDALQRNVDLEFTRNQERYRFLRWGQQAFSNFKVVPPNTGIVHQVNLEYLARVVFAEPREGGMLAFPDTVVGTDSHTTMINGLGVLGWGVGGIEAEAAMLGQPISMLIPEVVGCRLTGKPPEGATATDLVLTIVQMLRQMGVVGKLVEFFGDGLEHLPLADRATIANMAPEYGATCGIFPIDAETLRYLQLTGRRPEQVALVEAYAKAQGLYRSPNSDEAQYSALLELDMRKVEPSLAGPKRPQDRISLRTAQQTITRALHALQDERSGRTSRDPEIARFSDNGGGTAVGAAESRHSGTTVINYQGQRMALKDGAIVIAAITSCTNTSNPTVMLGAGLLAREALKRGLRVKPWVKTSLAPGSRVVTEYLAKSNLLADLEELGFHLVGYGCTTCIGNSGPLPEAVSQGIREGDLIVCAILSGNRNFEGRIHPQVTMNFLASPPLVVAYALAGTMEIDPYHEPLGNDRHGNPVFLRDIWPSQSSVQAVMAQSIDPHMFRASYARVFAGDSRWAGMDVPKTEQFEWQPQSTYIQHPPYFEDMGREPAAIKPIEGARVLALLGDSITTDHISPAGAINSDSPAGRYLMERGIEPRDFNSYGSRRGCHDVMVRGTFANVRLRNRLAPDTEGGWTIHQPSGELMPIYDAAMHYQQEGIPLIVIAGQEYGSGSSRDWAAKGPLLLGVRAVLAESFERIHRSNLIGMGILPLQFSADQNAAILGLSGTERFDIPAVDIGRRRVTVHAHRPDAPSIAFEATVRIDTPKEREYYQNGGILHYVLRQLLKG